MLNIIQKFTRTSPPDVATNEAAELLATCSLPDPEKLRREFNAFEEQQQRQAARWDALDQQHNPRASLEQTAITERLERLRLQIEALTPQIEVAEKRRAAFVALVETRRAINHQITQEFQRLYADFLLIASKDERRKRLELVDGLVRLRARIDAPLAVVSPSREFRRAPDQLGMLADDLRARADEIDRLRSPGMPRAPVAWPAGAHELIDALKGGTA
jgi:hypothetical protein